MERRIESRTSRTAEMTCVSRACSFMEKNPCYKSNDTIAPELLPSGMKPFLHILPIRRLFTRVAAPKGIYEYVIARTKYIDAVFRHALAERFDQILILGAGFDTRALRFQDETGDTRIFELDVPLTQQAKIGQYHKRHLTIPANLTFIPIDFDRESLPIKLEQGGFSKALCSLFILEGVIMYLQPESVDATFQVIRDYTGQGSRVVFDYIHASVLRKEGNIYGETGIEKTVSKAGEQWHFGIEEGQIETFLVRYDLRMTDHKDARALEKVFFTNQAGQTIGRVNGTHCLVTAEK